MFHKEGHKIILITTIIVITTVLLVGEISQNDWFQKLIQITAIVIFILILQFFRNPKRQIKHNDNHILSPVDGKVVVIEEVEENEYFKSKRLQVSVFMSPLNVHVTRFPLGGTVLYSKYHPGKYLVAWHPKSSTENERSTIVIQTEENQRVLFRQIAGAVARRICNYSSKGDEVNQNMEAGFIKFGSRVDVFIPKGSKIKVSLNDIIIGGETILAEI